VVRERLSFLFRAWFMKLSSHCLRVAVGVGRLYIF